MSESSQLNIFTDNLIQEVIAASESEEYGQNGEFRVNEFTRLASSYLVDSGEIEDLNVCYYKHRGMHINGYNINQAEDTIDLIVSIFNQQSPPVNVTKTQVDTIFRQAEAALKKALLGHHESMEESSEAYDMFQSLFSAGKSLSRVRIFLLTDGVVNAENAADENLGEVTMSFHVWDIQRMYRLQTSGQKFESIEIDFEKEFGAPLSCLPMVDTDSDYEGYLAVIPGAALANIYGKYGARLLERNVRSFLQVRGNVNKGIRQTVLEEPHRFFAYNNGIAATADEIDFEPQESGTIRIKKIRNLQIVNGGQTTASLYHAFKKDKADLKGIFVQAKISVIPPEHIDTIVPLISRYANSQNKVSDADFYANDPYHVKIEELSRTIWAPPHSGSNKMTKWFYERARGQYLDAKGREGTPARMRQFEGMCPKSQKFTKTDLAKYENTWMQSPHVVSLGAQKNFNHFCIQLKERGRFEVDSNYFENLVAKAIIFKRAEKIIGNMNYGGYRANIVTYTLAWISHHTAQRIDLGTIWKAQDVSAAFEETIRSVSKEVHQIIVDPPNGKNVTEWCKRKECWEKISEKKISIHEKFQSELLKNEFKNDRKTDKGIAGPDPKDLETIEAVSNVSSDVWFKIAKWAKDTNNLQPWQRAIAFSIGRLLASGKQVSYKQANQAVKILESVKSLGFDPDK